MHTCTRVEMCRYIYHKVERLQKTGAGIGWYMALFLGDDGFGFCMACWEYRTISARLNWPAWRPGIRIGVLICMAAASQGRGETVKLHRKGVMVCGGVREFSACMSPRSSHTSLPSALPLTVWTMRCYNPQSKLWWRYVRNFYHSKPGRQLEFLLLKNPNYIWTVASTGGSKSTRRIFHACQSQPAKLRLVRRDTCLAWILAIFCASDALFCFALGIRLGPLAFPLAFVRVTVAQRCFLSRSVLFKSFLWLESFLHCAD